MVRTLVKYLFQSFRSKNLKAPNLRTNTKIHKQNFPVRPVVNYIPAPAYKIKKNLKNLLKTTLIIDNKYNIKNTVNLTEQLKDIKITNKTKIISLDIKNLYTNIPINETLDIIRDQLKLLNQDDDKTNQIISLLELTLKQNYFKYNNVYYYQKDGLPMGSPISSIISEIFLQSLENIHISTLKMKYGIIYYGRYVDDILVIYDDDSDQSSEILNSFNNIHSKLHFTLEKEINNSINFLDLKITKTNNKYISFDIFRKPTTSKVSINKNSIHPYNQKISNYQFLLHRLNNIPLSRYNYKKELNNIIEIAKFNNFSEKEIYKLNNKIRSKKYNR